MNRTITTFLFLLLLLFSNPILSQTTKIMVDELEREYLKFTPTSESSESSSLMVLLHYLGATATEFSNLCNAQQVADDYNMVILVPQALDEQDAVVASAVDMAIQYIGYTSLSTESIWGAGVSIKTADVIPAEYLMIFNLLYPTLAAAGKVEFNKGIDDVSFINTLINQTKSTHNIDATKIFVVGGSMGGAMTYKYAYNPTSQATGIGVFSGFIGAEVSHDTPLDIPVCIFHSEDDEVVPLAGGIFSTSIPDLIADIVNQNGCVKTSEESFPDIANDGITASVIKYNTPYNKRVWHYSLKGAIHSDFLTSDYTTGPNDLDYLTEASKFFDLSKSSGFAEEMQNSTLYSQNGTSLLFNETCQFQLFDLMGRTIIKGLMNEGEEVSLSHLPLGIYIIHAENNTTSFSNKLIVK